MKRVPALLFAASLATSVVAFAQSSPWDVPAPPGVEMLLAVKDPKKADTYVLKYATKPWDGANAPDKVDLPLPKEEKTLLGRCRGLAAKGEHDAAVMELDEIVSRNPSDWDAYVLRAASRHARKADDEAVAALRTSLVGNRRNPDAWKLLDGVTEAMGRRVARPRVDLRGWVRDLGKAGLEVGHVVTGDLATPWSVYAAARAYYRCEGPFARDFPQAKTYVFTFREQMFAMGALATALADAAKNGAKLTPDAARILDEQKAGTLAEFTFFAVYTEPVGALPEKGFDALRPRLAKYFDEKIVVKR
jgi:hypothetical protein